MIFADIPEKRLAKVYKANQLIDNMLNESGIRVVWIGNPTEEQSKVVNQLDFKIYEKMHWEAANADYKQISEKRDLLKKMLKKSKKVQVTSPKGINFSFSMSDHPIFLDDGILTKDEAKGKLFLTRIASLPGGSVFLLPLKPLQMKKLLWERIAVTIRL